MAHRDILRSEDDANRISGVLGISVAGARESVAISKVDRRDGSLRSPEAEDLGFNVSKFQGFKVDFGTIEEPCNLETLKP
jgi:hypothetical protein